MYIKVLAIILKTSLCTFLCIISPCIHAQSAFFNQIRSGRIDSANKITWTQHGPGNGGWTDLVRYHPTVPDTVFFGPDFGANYQSDNNGLSYYSVKDPDAGSGFNRLQDLTYSLSDETRGLALEGSHMWQTTNRGRDWSLVLNCPWYTPNAEGADRFSFIAKVSCVAIDPQNANVWYVGSGLHPRGQAIKSKLNDATAANPRGPNVDLSGKIWKTTNAGASWTELTNGLDTRAQFCRIMVDPRNSQRVYAGSNYGFYRSENGGSSWTNVGVGQLPNNTIMDFDYYFNGSTFILYLIDQIRLQGAGQTVTSNGGVYRSTNSGTSWQNISGNLAIDMTRLTGGGFGTLYNQYRDKWFGTPNNFTQLPTSVMQPLHMINVDPSRPNSVYVGLSDPQQTAASFGPGILWATTNGGTSWTSVARAPSPAWGLDRNYWTERGNPWQPNINYGHEPFNIQFGNNYAIRSMRNFDVNSRGDVMMISAHNLLLSTDNGATWNQVDEDYTPAGNIMGRGNSDLPGESLGQDTRLAPGVHYLGSGEHRLWKTSLDGTNGREAMTFLNTAFESVSSIAFHPDDVKTIFITSLRQKHKEEIWRSTDGVNFSPWGIATPAEEFMRTHDLTIDPINPQFMYFGITDRKGADLQKEGGFYFSSDGGRTFSPRNSGLPNPVRIRDIEWDPRDSTYQSMFVAAQKSTFAFLTPLAEGGLYHTSNRGQSWTKISVDPQVDGVNAVKFDQTGRLYITSGHRGSSVGGLWYSDDFGQTWAKTFDAQRTESFDVSPFDPNVLVVKVGRLSRNPGIYLSEDRGQTWTKNNQDLAVNDQILDVEFSVHDPEVLWLVGAGMGFNKGDYSGLDVLRYDFGGPTSPLQDRFTRVSPTTANATLSWNQAPQFRDRGTINSANNLTRDIVFDTVPRTFNHRIANGTWHVTAKLGEAQFDATDMAVKAEGITKASGIDAKAGKFATVNFSVNVTDGELNLEFSGASPGGFWNINSLILTRLKGSSPAGQQPFGGTARSLTNRLQAEDYDTGGQGMAYNDNDAADQGGQGRTGEGVDVENTADSGGGTNVGWIAGGEWLEYTVNVPAGTYNINLRTASASGNPGSLQVSLDGTNLGTINVTSTGGWQTWTTEVLSNVSVPAASNGILRLTAIGGGFNLNWIQFVASSPAGQQPFGGTARSLTNRLQAEDYDTGGQGVAYNDNDAADQGGQGRTGEGVDVENTADSGGGTNVGWIAGGEWLEYTVNVPAGTYNINLRTASASGNPGSLQVSLNDTNLGTVNVTSTGGWQTWTTEVLSNVSVPAASNGILRLTAVGGGFNLNWIQFVESSSGGGGNNGGGSNGGGNNGDGNSGNGVGTAPQTTSATNTGPFVNAATYQWDFGTNNSPLFDGYSRVTNQTNQGYARWTNTSGLNAADRGGSQNALNRDFVWSGQPRTFIQEIANGSYTVTLNLFDANFLHDNMRVRAEGIIKLDNQIFGASAGNTTQSFEVDVTDGQLDLEFSDQGGNDSNWVLNRIVVTRNAATNEFRQYDFGTPGSPVGDGHLRVSPNTQSGEYRWTNSVAAVDRGTAGNNNAVNRDLNYSNQTRNFEVTGLSNGNWQVEVTIGDASFPHDNIRVSTRGGIIFNSESVAANQFKTESRIQNVTDGKIIVTFSDQGGSDVNWVVTRIRLVKQ